MSATVESCEQVSAQVAKPASGKASLRGLRGFIVRVVVIAVAVWLVGFVVFGFSVNHEQNMAPWMRDGDLVVTYKLDVVYPDDVVAYRHDESLRFGRIVAQAGDVVDVQDERYTINGSVPVEKVYYDTKPAEGGAAFPLEVKDGEVFVMNDMREDTKDSRQFGAIELDDVEGKVVLTVSRRGF